MKIITSDLYQKVCLYVKTDIYQFLQNLKSSTLRKGLLEGTGKCLTYSLVTLNQTLDVGCTFLKVLNSFG